MVRMRSVTELPPPNTKRWVARRKAAVVKAVCSGKITLEKACQLYQLSEEEFHSWQRTFETSGVDGLRATCVQQYRVGRFSLLSRQAPTETPTLDSRQRIGAKPIPAGFLPAGED